MYCRGCKNCSVCWIGSSECGSDCSVCILNEDSDISRSQLYAKVVRVCNFLGVFAFMISYNVSKNPSGE